MGMVMSRFIKVVHLVLLACALASLSAHAQTQTQQKPPPGAKEAAKEPVKEDPFADLSEPPKAKAADDAPTLSWRERFFKDNFGFRKEVMLQVDTDENGNAASIQSVGFEVLKKFSTATSTFASFNFQGRLVRRDGFNPVQNDMEGMSRGGWAFEYHNLYLDFYNILNPLLTDEQRGENVGRFNFRVGRFYVPFGLNLQTDTHGTVLQLSNERDFGFERDWYTGFWGTLNKHLNYDLYYMAGSGYDLKFKGQSGLGALRISLANQYSSKYGLEGGLSFIGGERLSSEAKSNEPNTPVRPIQTERAAVDGRFRKPIPTGLLTFSTELSGGRDVRDPVFMQLHQLEYLNRSRRWGAAAQYRRFTEEAHGADASMIGEVTWYFRNDVGNANLHWIKLNVERQLERMQGRPQTIVTLQYYFYR